MQKIGDSVWNVIGQYLGFDKTSMRLFAVSRDFRKKALFWLRITHVSIHGQQSSLNWIAKYAEHIDELHLNCDLPIGKFSSLTRLGFCGVANCSLSAVDLPRLQHLELLDCGRNCIINKINLLSLYISGGLNIPGGWIETQQLKGINSLEWLHFAPESYSYNGVVDMIQTLPSLTVLQIDDDDARSKVQKAFPKIHVDFVYQKFTETWISLMKSRLGPYCSVTLNDFVRKTRKKANLIVKKKKKGTSLKAL